MPGVHINSFPQPAHSCAIPSRAFPVQGVCVPPPLQLRGSVSPRSSKTPLSLKGEEKQVMGTEDAPLWIQMLRASRVWMHVMYKCCPK